MAETLADALLGRATAEVSMLQRYPVAPVIDIKFDPITQEWVDNLTQGLDPHVLDDVMQQWYNDATMLFNIGVRGRLGLDTTYHLHPVYAAVKRQNPYLAKIPDKDPDQPLILTGSLYSAINVTQHGDGLNVTILPIDVPQRARFFNYRSIDKKKSGGTFKFTDIHGTEHVEELKTFRQRTPYKRRKKTTAGIDTWNVAKYGAEWEDKTHFITNGIEDALPHVSDRLQQLVVEAVEAELGISSRGTTFHNSFQSRTVMREGKSVQTSGAAFDMLAHAFPGGVPNYIVEMSRQSSRR